MKRGMGPSEETAVEETGEKGTEVGRHWCLESERDRGSEKRGEGRKSGAQVHSLMQFIIMTSWESSAGERGVLCSWWCHL